MRKMYLEYYQTVIGKLDQCCKVTEITVLLLFFNVDVDKEIIQIKRCLKTGHVFTQMKGLVLRFILT